MLLLNPVNIKYIILHCSASVYGDVPTIDQWHKERGWTKIGYHYIICNSYPKYENYKSHQPDPAYDGLIQIGRSEKFQGAHAKGHNWESLGVCLVGEGCYTSHQLASAAKLCRELMDKYPNISMIKGHNDFTDKKECPLLDVEYFSSYILNDHEDDMPQPMFDPTISLRDGI